MDVLRWFVCLPALLATLASATPLAAQVSAGPIQIAQAARGTSEGEIRDIDRGAKKVTIKHQAFKGLDMPAMTMTFQVRDVRVLDRVKAGDKVSFQVEQVGSAMVVTAIQPAK